MLRTVAVANALICALSLFSFYRAVRCDGDFDCTSLDYNSRSQFGKAQYIREHPPPYKFYFLNRKHRGVTHYKDGSFTIRLNGTTYFRRFLIQARRTTKAGYLMGSSSGKFRIKKSKSDDDAPLVKLLQCASNESDTVVNFDNEKKQQIDVRWIPKRNDGPIQFVIYIEQDPEVYWVQWTPRSGHITPYNSEPFESEKSSNTSYAIVDENAKIKQRAFFIANLQQSNSDGNLQTTGINQTSAMNSSSHEDVTPPELIVSDATPPPLIFKHRNTTDQSINENFIFRHISIIDELPIEAKSSDPKKTCDNLKCYNNGTCANNETGASCTCTDDFSGPNCTQVNYCNKNRCQNGGVCENEEYGYICICKKGFSGKLCQFNCPSYVCENNGTCYLDNTNRYACICPEGFFGDSCEFNAKNITDNCQPNPCLRGAQCFNVNNTFKCGCPFGYVGKKCHRPCQNIYRSCEDWKGDDSCESLRNLTDFFDINCPVSCNQCMFDETSVRTFNPLPPALDPLQFLLGVWVTQSNHTKNFPIDFDESVNGFTETLHVSIPLVSMFGLPSLNFISIAVGNSNDSVPIISVGFLNAKEADDKVKISLTTIVNEGFTLIEEGELEKDKRIVIKPVFEFVNPVLTTKSIKKTKRKFSLLHNSRLVQTVERQENENGPSVSFKKIYTKQRSYVPY